jgi:hypothetical protein
MARHGAGSDLLGTIEGCLVAVHDQADAAGIELSLILSVNPALVRIDTTPLHEVGRHLLRYALGEVRRGHRLLVRLDLTTEEVVTLEIDEEGPVVGQGSIRSGLQRRDEAAADVATVRGILDAAGGRLAVLRCKDGSLHLVATLPCCARRPRSP